MFDVFLRQHRVCFEQCFDDRAVGLANFAVGFIDIESGKAFDVRQIASVIADGFIEFDVVFFAEVEIVLAVAGGDVDKAGAGVGGDEVAEIERDIVVEIAFAAGAVAEGVRSE